MALMNLEPSVLVFILYDKVGSMHKALLLHASCQCNGMFSETFMGKEPFKVQDRQMDFNVTGFTKFTGMVSDFILQITFKKLGTEA